ncbi:hypothetical protein [Streptomyces mirabilis]|uniref:hypothetical protein n=1 Tax=Streptomyces mirabilis TaxID=68239 RepID=UPI0033CCB00E
MTFIDPTLAASVAAKRIPLTADLAPLTAAREAEIREHVAAMTNFSVGNLAARDLLAEVDRLRAELQAAPKPHTPRLCICGHSNHAHTVPAPHSCFAFGQTCPCPQYRQLLPAAAEAQLERNRAAAAAQARYDEEAAS